ncbi:hypothetical protein ACYT84_10685 [Ralstonia solanacearum]|nr:hypothetical protein [Ralstonia solanacearum]
MWDWIDWVTAVFTVAVVVAALEYPINARDKDEQKKPKDAEEEESD